MMPERIETINAVDRTISPKMWNWPSNAVCNGFTFLIDEFTSLILNKYTWYQKKIIELQLKCSSALNI